MKRTPLPMLVSKALIEELDRLYPTQILDPRKTSHTEYIVYNAERAVVDRLRRALAEQESADAYHNPILRK